MPWAAWVASVLGRPRRTQASGTARAAPTSGPSR
ncbi:hypothetical protein [Kitasatospora sp. NBC_00240]